MNMIDVITEILYGLLKSQRMEAEGTDNYLNQLDPTMRSQVLDLRQ